MTSLRFGNLPTLDPLILTMMAKQRTDLQTVNQYCSDYQFQIRQMSEQLVSQQHNTSNGGTQEQEYIIHNLQQQILMHQNQMQHFQSIVSQQQLDYNTLSNTMTNSDETIFGMQSTIDAFSRDYELLKLDHITNKQELSHMQNTLFWLGKENEDMKEKLLSENIAKSHVFVSQDTTEVLYTLCVHTR